MRTETRDTVLGLVVGGAVLGAVASISSCQNESFARHALVAYEQATETLEALRKEVLASDQRTAALSKQFSVTQQAVTDLTGQLTRIADRVSLLQRRCRQRCTEADLRTYLLLPPLKGTKGNCLVE